MLSIVVIVGSGIKVAPADEVGGTARIVSQCIKIYLSADLNIFIVDIEANA